MELTQQQPTARRRGRRGGRRRNNNNNGNEMIERLSPEERRELLKRKDMERMWEDNGRFTRWQGHEGFDREQRRERRRDR